MKKRQQQLAAFLFGVTFVVVMLAVAIEFPNPTSFQYTVFRIVLSLAAAGVAAMIPGFIELQVATWIRAGGALAVFAIVFFYNPAAFVTSEADTSEIAGEFYAQLGSFRSKAEADQLKSQLIDLVEAAGQVNTDHEKRNIRWTYPRGLLFARSDICVEPSLEKSGDWIVAIDLIKSGPGPELEVDAEDKLKAIRLECDFFLNAMNGKTALEQKLVEKLRALAPRIESAQLREYSIPEYQRLYHRSLKNVSPVGGVQ